MTDQARLNKREWCVRPVVLLDAARWLIERFHYAAGESNTATYCHGLWRRGEELEDRIAGVAWWIPPTKSAAQALEGDNWNGVLSLSRLVILPGVPANACSFLIRRSMRQIDRSRWPVLVTYADEWRGHSGSIYLAAGWQYDGVTKPEATYTIEGRMVARKAGGKTRTHDEMLALGAVMVGRFRKKRFVHRIEPLRHGATEN